MTINLTFLVQILHFFCAYWIMRKFFFAPAVDLVFKKRLQQETLKKLIDSYEVETKKEKVAMVEMQQVFTMRAQQLVPPSLILLQERRRFIRRILDKIYKPSVICENAVLNASIEAQVVANLCERVKHDS